MKSTRTCPQCGEPLRGDATTGRCLRCFADSASSSIPATATVPDTAAASPSNAGRTSEVRHSSATENPGDIIGRYKLVEKLGEGGCGVVYLAEQSEPVRRKVALKVIKLGMDTKAVIARFEAERQTLAMMDHPNIAQVFDAGATATGRPYFVMELVHGSRITNYCDENNLATPERLDLFTAVCSAIQHAHQKGIIHRDIKPSNILVTLHDGVPVPKVIDFGIAKATEARLTELTLFTELNAFLGTPAYMSPEQAEMSGLDIDTRADIYSLGVLLYELLTGRLPFDAEKLIKGGLDEMRRTIREVEPPKPSTRLSTVTGGDLTTIAKHRGIEAGKLSTLLRGDLDWIVMKALEKDRTRRYESASAFAQDIKRYLGNEAVLACPPSAAYLFQKLVRRHRLAFTAGTAVAASVVIGLGVSTWLFFQEKAARERAVTAEQEQVTLRTQADTARANEQQLRVQAQSNEEKARTEAAKSEQVAKFLSDMLQGVGPSVARGRDTGMLREILDATANRVGKDLKDQPEVEAELRMTLGIVYRELGEYQKAEAMLQAALATRRRLFGNDDSRVGHALQVLALILFSDGRLSEAESLHWGALAIYRKSFGNEHANVARVLDNLGNVLQSQWKLVEAGEVFREGLAMRRKSNGDEHLEVALSLGNLAALLRLQGKLTEAETMHREALAIRRTRTGRESPDTAMSLNMLANTLRDAGKLAEAETMYREALKIRKQVLGVEHPSVAQTLDHMAVCICRQGRLAEAETLNREALAMRRKLLRSGHPSVVDSLLNLARVLREEGKFAEAEAHLRECLEIRSKTNVDDWSAFEVQSMLGSVLTGQQRFSEAEPLLLSGYDGLRRHQDKIGISINAALKDALTGLLHFYEATAQPAKAAEWKQRLTEFEQAAATQKPTAKAGSK